MLVRVLLAAILAGVFAGAFATAAQSYRVLPLIQEAERYETAEHSHGGEEHSESAGEIAEAWKPDNGLERTLFTTVANVIVGVSFPCSSPR